MLLTHITSSNPDLQAKAAVSGPVSGTATVTAGANTSANSSQHGLSSIRQEMLRGILTYLPNYILTDAHASHTDIMGGVLKQRQHSEQRR